jgi:hypothetical protein
MAAIKLSVRYPPVIMMIILVNPKRSAPIALEMLPESRTSEIEPDCCMIITSILSANIVHN